MKTHSKSNFVGRLMTTRRTGLWGSRGTTATVAGLLLLLGAASGAHAALMGDTVSFDNVTVGLWGEPAVEGDTLVFTPLEFEASQAGGPGVDLVTGSVAFDIWANPGYQITGVDFAEAGESMLFGDGLTIVRGTLTAGATMTKLAFPDTGNEFAGPGGFDFADPAWAAEAAVDLSASPVAHLHVVLQNKLLAVAPGVLDVADINKALATLEVTTVVPEPLSMLLVGTSIGILVALRRRPAQG
jgi:hypothetical protein